MYATDFVDIRGLATNNTQGARKEALETISEEAELVESNQNGGTVEKELGLVRTGSG
eukprot:SAG11_NODE_6301_length_1342_cov_1.228479_2_plen_57_part_00